MVSYLIKYRGNLTFFTLLCLLRLLGPASYDEWDLFSFIFTVLVSSADYAQACSKFIAIFSVLWSISLRFVPESEYRKSAVVHSVEVDLQLFHLTTKYYNSYFMRSFLTVSDLVNIPWHFLQIHTLIRRLDNHPLLAIRSCVPYLEDVVPIRSLSMRRDVVTRDQLLTSVNVTPSSMVPSVFQVRCRHGTTDLRVAWLTETELTWRHWESICSLITELRITAESSSTMWVHSSPWPHSNIYTDMKGFIYSNPYTHTPKPEACSSVFV
jgi:hypothetical protein